MPEAKKLSVIMPLLNEEQILEQSVTELAEKLDEVVGPQCWQLVPVDNGSTDKTPEILEQIKKKWPNTLNLRLEEKNIGKAMKHGLLNAEYPIAMILPLDEFDSSFLTWAWENTEKYDLILGSKRVDPTMIKQPPYRRLLSWGLNSLLQLSLQNVTADTHGAKLVKLATVRPHIEKTVISRGQFDTELTLRVLRAGLWVAEVPVSHEELRPPRNLMLTKIGRNIVDLIRLNFVMKDVEYKDHVRYHRFCIDDLNSLTEK